MSKKPTSLMALEIERRHHGKIGDSLPSSKVDVARPQRAVEELSQNLPGPSINRPVAATGQLAGDLAVDRGIEPISVSTNPPLSEPAPSAYVPQQDPGSGLPDRPSAASERQQPGALVAPAGELIRRRPSKEKPAEVPRTQIGARVPATLAKRLARYCLEEEESQQDAVTAALEEFLGSYGY